jgi:hypothetical protein
VVPLTPFGEALFVQTIIVKPWKSSRCRLIALANAFPSDCMTQQVDTEML